MLLANFGSILELMTVKGEITYGELSEYRLSMTLFLVVIGASIFLVADAYFFPKTLRKTKHVQILNLRLITLLAPLIIIRFVNLL